MTRVQVALAIAFCIVGCAEASATTIRRQGEPPCKPPPACAPGSFVIELQVYSNGTISTRVESVHPESLRPLAMCVAKHADYYMPARPTAPGTYPMPFNAVNAECVGPNNSFKPKPLRGSA